MKNPLAFPKSMISLNGPFSSFTYSEGYGMDLRDYFAAKAMQSMNIREDYIDAPADVIALDSYALADAMLKAREA